MKITGEDIVDIGDLVVSKVPPSPGNTNPFESAKIARSRFFSGRFSSTITTQGQVLGDFIFLISLQKLGLTLDN